MNQPRLGIIVAVKPESTSLQVVTDDTDHAPRICVAGMGPERARCATRKLVAQNLHAIVSWGFAGGVDPRLAVGTVVLPKLVIRTDGTLIETDREWRGRVAAVLRGSLPLVSDALCETHEVLNKPRHKERFAHTCAAVDMESGAVGSEAQQAGIPFLVIRAIADTAAQSLPACAADAVGASGKLHMGKLLRGLIKQPADIVPLLKLTSSVRQANFVLIKVARSLGPSLLAP